MFFPRLTFENNIGKFRGFCQNSWSSPALVTSPEQPHEQAR